MVNVILIAWPIPSAAMEMRSTAETIVLIRAIGSAMTSAILERQRSKGATGMAGHGRAEEIAMTGARAVAPNLLWIHRMNSANFSAILKHADGQGKGAQTPHNRIRMGIL